MDPSAADRRGLVRHERPSAGGTSAGGATGTQNAVYVGVRRERDRPSRRPRPDRRLSAQAVHGRGPASRGAGDVGFMTASGTDAQNEGAMTGGRPGEADPPARARILVADDDALFRRTLVDWLERAGYEVEAVEDAHAAQQALAERRYDLVIADIQMPGNTQLELLHALREKRIAVPVIL